MRPDVIRGSSKCRYWQLQTRDKSLPTIAGVKTWVSGDRLLSTCYTLYSYITDLRLQVRPGPSLGIKHWLPLHPDTRLKPHLNTEETFPYVCIFSSGVFSTIEPAT